MNTNNEQLEAAKGWYKIAKEQNNNVAIEILENMFPELAKSEDERIRKELLNAFQESEDSLYMVLTPYKRKAFIAWLKKQGEQKPAFEIKTPEESLGIDSETYNKIVDECVYGEQKPTDKVEPLTPKVLFKKGDFVVIQETTYQITKVENLNVTLSLNGRECSFDIDVLKNARLWDITKDAKDGDVLVNWNNTIYLFKGIEEEVVKFYCYYNTNCEEFKTPLDNNSHLGLTELQFEHHPATKEQRDTLMKAMADAGYTFDFDKKELKKIEQKSAWSEEDEKTRKALINLVEMYYGGCFDKTEKNRLLNFLKSLRPQSRWKPSDEQMEALKGVQDGVFRLSILQSLYDDLLKLTK